MPTGTYRIAVVAPLAGGSASVAACAARALQRLGHQVLFVDNQRFGPAVADIRQSPAPVSVQDGLIAEIFQGAAAATRRAVLSFHPSWVLYLAQAPVASDEDVLELRERGVPTVFWFVEDHRVFPYWRNVVGRFDHFWTIQEGAFPSELLAAGQRFVQFVPLACDPELHHRYGPEETAPYAADIAFAGSGYPNRLRLLAALADLRPRIYGTYWSREPALGPMIAHDGTLPHGTLARIFAATRVNLNLSSSLTSEPSAAKDFVNPRTFEICGCGGFQLADAAIPVERFFDPGQEVVLFASIEEARDRARYYLAHEDERRQIAERGARRAHAQHTYDQRLRDALDRLTAVDGDRLERAAAR